MNRKNTYRNFGGLLLSAAFTLAGSVAPAMADAITTTEVTTTTTQTKMAPVVLQGTVITAPTMSVEGLNGKAVTAQSPFAIPLTKFTASNGVTIFYAGPRDDKDIRRDDLLARILIEQAAGALSASTSSDFVNRLVRIDAMKASNPADTNSRAYNEHVRDIYDGYDKLAQDLKSTSHMGDRELAGKYTYNVY
jgi:hypothetical protein